MKRKKRVEERPKFPGRREEFAGELTPQIWPGPVTRAHPGRFASREARKADDVLGNDDNGVWTRDGV